MKEQQWKSTLKSTYVEEKSYKSASKKRDSTSSSLALHFFARYVDSNTVGGDLEEEEKEGAEPAAADGAAALLQEDARNQPRWEMETRGRILFPLSALLARGKKEL